MKLRKRCLAALLALTMLLTLIPFGSVFAEETKANAALSDIDANTTVGKAVTELSKLNIINGYEDGTFRPDNTITRGEIAKIVITFMNQQDAAFDTIPSGFADVDSVNHWAKKYIKLAADQKIVNGYPDGTFLADNPVKYTEIVKMLVCMLGYGSIAEARTIPGGAWYSGYMAIAAEKGILNNAAVNNVEDNASRATVAILTYNCLQVETAETDSSGNTIINTGSTALDKYQGKEKITGVVTGVQQTGIETGDTGLAKRQITVQVKGEEVLCQIPSDVDPMSILGRKISAYVEEGDSDGDYITQITTEKTETVTVPVNLIDEVGSRSLSFYKSATSSKTDAVTLSDDLKVVYNGKYDSTFKIKDFEDILSGSIEFVCNDGDGDPEVAFVSSYETFVVNSTEKKAEPPKVYGKFGAGELTIPYDTKNVHFSLTKEGSSSDEETIVNSLTEWDVISVLRSKDSANGRAVWHGTVTSKKVSGRIKSTEGDDLKEINGKMYELSASYKAYTGTKPKMEAQDYVTLYLDHEGKIAAASASTTTTSVDTAYLITAAADGKIDGDVQVNLYNITGSTGKRTRKVASTVYIDGAPYKSAQEVLAALGTSAEAANAGKKELGLGTTEYSQLVRYTLNNANEVDMIDTIVDNASPAEDDLSLGVAFPLASNGNADKTLKYNAGGRFVDDKSSLAFMVDSSTKVIEIPYDSFGNSDKYVVRSYSSAFTANASYQVEAYNVSATKTAKYVISYVGGKFGTPTINEKSPMMIATEISGILNADQEPIDKATGYTFPGAGSASVESETSGLLKDKLAIGDIFRYAESNGKVCELQKLLAFGTTRPQIFNVKKDNADIAAPIKGDDEAAVAAKAKEQRSFKIDDYSRGDGETLGRFMFGTALDYDSKGISFTPTIKEDDFGIQNDVYESLNFSGAKVYLYDYTAKNDKVIVDASFDNIKAYDKLMKEQSFTEEKATAEASQILIYYTGAYSVKAVIVFKY